jgi:peptide/nickel transport system substrate-binding protein
MTVSHPVRRGRAVKGLALLAVLGLAAAACGDDSKESSDSTTATSAGASTSAVVSTIASTTLKPADDKPKRGGTLVYGSEAENATGWSPQYSQSPAAGYMPMRALYDSLMVMTDEGKAVPFLAEKMTSNATATQWTIKLRSGIKFHDGSALDAAAVKANLEGHRCSPLTATAMGEFGGCPATFDASKPEDAKTNRKPLSTIYKSITVDASDPLTLTIDLMMPYATLDQSYSTAIAYIASPKNVADPANGPKNPIGTGPFKFKSWTVNDKLELVKNPDYWLKAPDGQAYPYLDGLVFRPIDDIAARENCLRGNQCGIIMTSNGDAIAKFRSEKDQWNLFENNVGGETGYLMLNMSPQIGGKDNPLADQNFRIGLAKCINYDELNKLRNANATPVANGPFPPGTDGYLENTGYPKFDQAGGKKLIDDFKAAKGISGDVQLATGTTADPFNKGTMELINSYWAKCGVKGNIDQTEQGQYITRALVGDFQMFQWRNHGSLEADRNFIWWHSSLALDAPNLALNFGRIKDKAIDDALVTIRTNPDAAARKAAAQAVNKTFGEKVYNIWTAWTLWQYVANKNIQNVGGSIATPEGAKAANTIGRAMHWFQQVWIK